MTLLPENFLLRMNCLHMCLYFFTARKDFHTQITWNILYSTMSFYMSGNVFGCEHLFAIGARKNLYFFYFQRFFFVDTFQMLLEHLFFGVSYSQRSQCRIIPSHVALWLPKELIEKKIPTYIASVLLVNILMSMKFTLTNHFYITNFTFEHSDIIKFLVVPLELPHLPKRGPTSSTKDSVAIHVKFNA